MVMFAISLQQRKVRERVRVEFSVAPNSCRQSCFFQTEIRAGGRARSLAQGKPSDIARAIEVITATSEDETAAALINL
jgi:hypothetical protein